MAGIGFELRRMLDKGTLAGTAEACLYASLVGSGPWVLSIVAILAISMIGTGTLSGQQQIAQFQVSVTYLMVGSLLLTSLLQLVFTRFIADRLYEGQSAAVLGNLFGALVLTMLTAAGLGLLFWLGWGGWSDWLGPVGNNGRDVSLVYAALMTVALSILSGIWIVAIFASAIKAHRSVLRAFAVGYGMTVALSWLLHPLGLEGLLAGFVIGQACLLFQLLASVVRQYPGERMLSFGFLRQRHVYPSLILTGLLYTLGVWVDKFVFWADPLTGVALVGPLRSSPLYDIPTHIGYLSLIPGMAMFLMTIETDFADKCATFFNSARDGATLRAIRLAKADMVASICSGFIAIVKVQATTIVILLLLGDDLIDFFGISRLYRGQITICLLASGLQLLLLAILNVFFYLDARRHLLGLCALFAVCNAVFSWITLGLGPAAFGYGFTFALMVTVVVGGVLLVRKLEDITYRTFMLQPMRH
jgi:uncharacterized membrane protein